MSDILFLRRGGSVEIVRDVKSLQSKGRFKMDSVPRPSSRDLLKIIRVSYNMIFFPFRHKIKMRHDKEEGSQRIRHEAETMQNLHETILILMFSTTATSKRSSDIITGKRYLIRLLISNLMETVIKIP